MRTKTERLPDTTLTIQGLHRTKEADCHFWYLKALCELSGFRQKKEVNKQNE